MSDHASSVVLNQALDAALAEDEESVRKRAEEALPIWRMYGAAQRWIFLLTLFLVTTSSYFDYYVLSILLEPIKSEFGVSDTLLGLLSGFCFAVFYSVSALPIAKWADGGNRRKIISLSLVAWSTMTALCGMVQSFWLLAVSRFGVGLVEPGAVPPSQSLIADYFPPERRATAIAILIQGGSAAGWLTGVSIGGYVAATHGWRAAFLVAGVTGLVLAVITWLILPEPRVQRGFPAASEGMEVIAESVARLRTKRSFVLGLIGISVYAVFAYGISIFLPSFMMRSLHASLMQISLQWGVAISFANIVGAVLGGWLADRLGKADVRWYAWLPAISCLLGLPLYWWALSADDLTQFIAIDFIAEATLAMGPPVIFAAIHAVCGSRRRAVAIAIVNLSFMLLGSGLGPLVAGALSDAFGARFGAESLRMSLTSLLVVLVPAAVTFYLAGRAMPKELED